MTAVLEGSEWSVARPGRTLPPAKTRYPLYRRLGGPQGGSGRAENLVLTGIRSRTFQLVVQSLYRLSYRAHLSHIKLCNFHVLHITADLLANMPDCGLEVSIRKVLRPATSTQYFLGFPVSISKCLDGSQDSKLPLHASHVALPTSICNNQFRVLFTCKITTATG